MNDRIQQLAKQAYLYQEDDNFLTAALEHFAELIVRQCIFEMMHESTLQDNTKIQDFSVAVANRIEKHFGVEE
jgi:hypothetical protein